MEIRKRQLVATILGTAAALWIASCGGGSDSSHPSCQPVAIVGTEFTSPGTATLTGKGTLPGGIPDGLELELLVETGGASLGVLPDSLAAPNRVCGSTFQYTVKGVPGGTHRLRFEIFDPNDPTVMPAYEGSATQDFTIADGQTLTFDATFTLATM